jgi:hypothetical protein
MLSRALALVAALLHATAAMAQATPLPGAHAHNDYAHDRPLLDALDRGFMSVEADIWLADDGLLVAHEIERAQPGRTLEALYLDPLKGRVAANGGTVHPGQPGFTLMIDIKSEQEATYAALDRVLSVYADMLTVFEDAAVKTGAVTVVVTGNRPRATMLAQPNRLAGYDGRLADLDAGLPASFMPLISDSWARHFSWTGAGPMPEIERDKLAEFVATAHAKGARVRFWETPDAPGPEREAVWQALRQAGVDLLNSDDLDGLKEFLTRP